MKPIIIYLIQVFGASGILYGYYHFFLRNKKFHQYNRFYLLCAIVISLVVPFLNIPLYFNADNTTPTNILKSWYTITDHQNLEIPASTFTRVAVNARTFNWNILINCLYVLIILILLTRMILSLIKLRGIVKNNPVEKLDRINLVETSDPDAPFSFFRWLFWNKEIKWGSAKGDQVFRHEFFHIQQRHSLDLLFLELVNILFWINPFFHLIRKEVKTIHEFLADSFAATEQNKWDYTELLLMRALRTKNHLVNPFFHNQIKRRIAMITNSKTSSHQYLRKLLVLPVITVVVFLFAFSYKEITKTSPHVEVRFQDQIKDLPADVYETQDTSKAFLEKVLRININVKEFMIEKPGYDSATRHIIPDLVIMNGNNYSLTDFMKKLTNASSINAAKIIATPPDNADAIRKYGVIAKKGVIELRNAQFELKTETIKNLSKLTGQNPPNQPLIIIDGKIMEDGYFKNLNSIDPNTVESINILKDKSATDIYGEPGKNGVIIINTRKIEPVTVTDRDNRPVFTEMEIEPAFSGGVKAWSTYLEQNMDKSIPSTNGANPGIYSIFIQFIVSDDGSISDIKALTNHGYGMEAEAIRLIRNSPKWLPGMQNGKKIKGIRKQVFNFIVANRSTTKIQLPDVVLVAYTDSKFNSEKFKSSPTKPLQPPVAGSPEWRKYLERNINALIPRDEGWHAGTYEILVQFKKKMDGSISDITLLNFENSKTGNHCANIIEQVGNLKDEQGETVYIQPLIFNLIDSQKSIIVAKNE